eukprot:TRINITY_DN34872_c0_g1_i1.p1 TRINITY_DN34872_c0_g1~~TRINITY_DN34872_c0_g1_i1.p1  ORF type:complete len:208 (+),score=15.67 TRINITY_DN34872_c0_g1_i1:164-787(+)
MPMNPVNELRTIRDTIDKELDVFCKTQLRNALPEEMWHAKDALLPAPTHYRMPSHGEPVVISGMKSRPELNGAKAEVIGNNMDSLGRVTIRLIAAAAKAGLEEHTGKKMQIKASYLAPLTRYVPRRSSSTPNLSTSGASDAGGSSVVTCSRAGSYVSRRSGSSASSIDGLSQTGRSILSRSGRSAMQTGSERARLATMSPIHEVMAS